MLQMTVQLVHFNTPQFVCSSNNLKKISTKYTVLQEKYTYHPSCSYNFHSQDSNNFWFSYCLQCFDAVGWAAGRASGL